jgi:4,5:9,10-diseco-3-hydroxy-5,9,17-trioxoandrosta-1(10),2-diene-4-oate hydrolase
MEFPNHKFVNIDGSNVRVIDVGEGDVVLLIHGMFVASELWYSVLPFLRTQHRVVAIDIPGFGLSDRPKDLSFYSPDYIGSFFSKLAAALGIESATVIGNSLGGVVAIHLALQCPDLVSKLILVDTAGLGREISWTMRLSSVPLCGELFLQPSVRLMNLVLKHSVYELSHVDSELPVVLARYFSIPGTVNAQLTFLRMGVNVRGQTSVLTDETIGRLCMPVLIIWGTDDSALPVRHARRAHRVLKRSDLFLMTKAGHCPMLDNPADFASAVEKFLLA